MTNSILVTGATGNVGGEVARLLLEQGQPVPAAVSSPRSASKLPSADLPCAVLDFADAATYPAAFAGVDRLFLMRPPQMADVDKDIKPVIDAAVQAGVKHNEKPRRAAQLHRRDLRHLSHHAPRHSRRRAPPPGAVARPPAHHHAPIRPEFCRGVG